jgi:hypothetical protein
MKTAETGQRSTTQCELMHRRESWPVHTKAHAHSPPPPPLTLAPPPPLPPPSPQLPPPGHLYYHHEHYWPLSTTATTSSTASTLSITTTTATNIVAAAASVFGAAAAVVVVIVASAAVASTTAVSSPLQKHVRDIVGTPAPCLRRNLLFTLIPMSQTVNMTRLATPISPRNRCVCRVHRPPHTGSSCTAI